MSGKRARRERREAAARVGELPKLIGLISWFDEDPAWLAASVASLSKLDVDHLVAVDGAYRLLPDGKPSSPPEQAEAIRETAHGLGIGLTLHAPPAAWAGNETEKRSAMFALAEQVAVPDFDWYFVLDADEVVVSAPRDLRERLKFASQDSGQTTVLNHAGPEAMRETRFDWNPISPVEIPKFFRAIPGLRVEGTHYCYRLPDGRDLWGHGVEMARGERRFVDCRDVRIEHRTKFRAAHRSATQRAYYERRDRLKIEVHACVECGEPSTRTVPAEPEMLESGELSAFSAPVCDACFPGAKATVDEWCRQNGVPLGYFEQTAPIGENAA